MPEINYNQLKKNISEGCFSKVYLLNGEEYIVNYFETAICEKILGKKPSVFNLAIFDAESLNIDKLAVALETFPVSGDIKCTVVKNLQAESWNNEQIENFINVISDIPDFSVMIISRYESANNAKSAVKFKKIKKAVLENGMYGNFTQKDIPIEKQLIFWAKKDYQKTLSPQMAQKILKKCENHNLTALKNELEKICELESTDTVTENSLKNLSGSNLKISIFDLPKAIFANQTSRALEIMNTLLEQKELPFSIVNIINAEYIDMYRVKMLLNEEKEIAELTQIFDYKNKEFRLKNAKRRCQNVSTENIKKCLDLLLKADVSLKSTQIDPKIILTELIINLIRNI